MKTLKENTATTKLFICIDIHKRSWKIFTATDMATGKGHTIPPSGRELRKCVDKHYRLSNLSFPKKHHHNVKKNN